MKEEGERSKTGKRGETRLMEIRKDDGRRGERDKEREKEGILKGAVRKTMKKEKKKC